MIGHRLKLARNAAGLSLRGLADAMQHKVTAQAIGRYERDEIMPSSSVLLALSRALKVAPDYLMSQRDITLHGIEFRKAASARAKEERTVEAKVVEQLERYIALEEALGLAQPRDKSSHARLDPIESMDDAEHRAVQLRRSWHLGVDPIPSMMELLEERGIKIIALDLPANVSGSMVEAQLAAHGRVPAIIVNANHTGERQRFTLAHELGHLLLAGMAGMTARNLEKAMDRFAGAFLVPAEELTQLAGRHRQEFSIGELVELKKHFRVSLQCLVVRLSQVGILSKTAYGQHRQMLEALGILMDPYPEPEPLASERPTRLRRLALRAVAEDALSAPKAAELLGVPTRQLNEWLEQGITSAAA
ncbi:MAG: helix-turn-helix domain-containing protein [Dehalococcoidia bacterium]